MPIYEYRCACGRTVEVLAGLGAPPPMCPACGAQTRKSISGFAVGGRADAGLSQSRMPQTWKGTYDGNPEYATGLRREWEQRRRLEEGYPELAGDSRPLWPTRVPTQPSRCAPATPPLRQQPGARGPRTTLREGNVGGGHRHPYPHGHLHPHPETPQPTRSGRL
jgi:putative FmdB family regulatory protein